MPREHWHQHNLTFPDRDTARTAATGVLGPALTAAQTDGLLTTWWYMNKQPWPLRYCCRGPAPAAIRDLLDKLAADGRITAWTSSVYEPETVAFGGEQAMATAHDLFHHDSRHLLTCAQHLGARETAVLLCSTMLRAAGLDWYEQGDVWAKAAALRPPDHGHLPEQAAAHLPALRRLMTADTHTQTGPGGPLAGHDVWIAAFERAGRDLARLARTGQLSRGLRAVLAHHVIFHANRAALPLEDQRTLYQLAREVVMTTSDHTAPAQPHTTDANAERLRHALVDRVVADGRVRTPRIETTLRSVPRHVFVPHVSLDVAYADTTVDIKRDEDGTSISCASQPGVVGLMLEQLQPQPGDAVLELGAGSGYNAALLAHLVSGTGHVTTVDVDDDLVSGARARLAEAGIGNVTVVLGDGALGHPDGAPYQRIIATVGAHGVPRAWTYQLAPGGRLVVPQRLRGSVSRSIAYENHDGRWLSVGSEMNTFMPLRCGIADDERRIIPLTPDGTVRLQTHLEQAADVEALADVLDQPRTVEWSGVLYRAMESPEWMELWLTCTTPSGLTRMLFPRSAAGTVLTDDPYPSATAAFDKGALTYLTRRLSEQRTPDGGKLWEFGVVGHGPGADELAARITDSMRTWDRDHRGSEARFELLPLDAAAPVETAPGRFTVDTPLNRIVIDWQ
ncbi:methyltransferase, FxLD system [Actinacidiphila sp. bgisy167]|uniref:methyltransferase, FxLD system n=1 Tax=Actinacidiphila sp. bgisy167 TaxID=3413797 RepID=UPI003D717D59